MTVAISEVSLKEIYSLSAEEKLDLVDLIIKSMRTAASVVKPKVKITSWVDQFDGQWEDSKSADEMVTDLRAARTSNSQVVL